MTADKDYEDVLTANYFEEDLLKYMHKINTDKIRMFYIMLINSEAINSLYVVKRFHKDIIKDLNMINLLLRHTYL